MAFPEIAALVAATAVRDALATTLAREQGSGRFDSLREATPILALNAAHISSSPTHSAAPPDPRKRWWFVASLKCVGDELDDDFAKDAWPLLRDFGMESRESRWTKIPWRAAATHEGRTASEG